MRWISRLATAAVLFSAPMALQAQISNPEQTEAWAFISSAWERHADAGTWYESVDPAFNGWTTGYPVPTNRDTLERRARVFGPEGKFLFYRLDPLAVSVSGDTAIAYYFAEIVEANHNDVRKTSTQRCSNTLIRKGGKWRIFGWMCDTVTQG